VGCGALAESIIAVLRTENLGQELGRDLVGAKLGLPQSAGERIMCVRIEGVKGSLRIAGNWGGVLRAREAGFRYDTRCR